MLYKGGVLVAQGTYWDIAKGTRIDVVRDSMLPGSVDKTYLQASVASLLMVAPIFGLLFAVFLPFIGIAMAIGLLVRRVFVGAARTLSNSTAFGWKPLESYLSGRKKPEELHKTYRNVSDIIDALNHRKKPNDNDNK